MLEIAELIRFPARAGGEAVLDLRAQGVHGGQTAERKSSLRGPLVLGVVLFGLIYGVASATGFAPWPGDAQCYYLAQGEPLYGFGWLTGPCYSYSPAFSQVMAPLQALPWQGFIVTWETALFAALACVLGPVAWLVIVGGFLAAAFPVLAPLGWPFSDIALGNVQILIGLVCLAGFRRSWTWTFVLLSKVTPAVALLWYVGARQWRTLAVPLALAALLAAVSFVLAPNLWLDWIGLLWSRIAQPFPLWTFPVSLPVRLTMSAALALWGGATGRRWTVPLAAGWALPAAYPTMTLIWLAALPLTRRPHDVHHGGHGAAETTAPVRSPTSTRRRSSSSVARAASRSRRSPVTSI